MNSLTKSSLHINEGWEGSKCNDLEDTISRKSKSRKNAYLFHYGKYLIHNSEINLFPYCYRCPHFILFNNFFKSEIKCLILKEQLLLILVCINNLKEEKLQNYVQIPILPILNSFNRNFKASH